MSVVSEQEVKAGPAIPTIQSQDPHTKLHNARVHLISGLRDRGLKAPLKWSPWLSEVNIPDYREECRQLGDPMLFTRYQRLPTALCKKEEGELFSDTNSPLATYSYHLKNDSRRIHSRRSKRLGAEVGREVSISELHEIMSKGQGQTGNKRLQSSSLPQFSPPHGLSIAIQNSSSYSSIFDKLPKITLTIKQANDSKSLSSVKTKSRLSRSCERFASPAQVKLQRGLTSFDHSLKARHSQESEADTKTSVALKTKVDRNGFVNLHKLARMSRTQLTKDWLEESPLGAESVEEEPETEGKQQRRVRFGGGDWIYKDSNFVFD